jgi:ATP-dependent 26S proteasome regulatory subunit
MKGPSIMTTKSQAQATDASALLRARNPLIWIRTPEEVRVEGYLYEACATAKYVARTWDCAAGGRNLDGTQVSRIIGPDGQFTPDIGTTLDYISGVATGVQPAERCAWILRDLHKWTDGPLGITTCRQLRNLARLLPGVQDPNRWQALIIIAPTSEVPADLAGDAVVIDWPLPDRTEIGKILDRIAKVCAVDLNGQREPAIDAAVGMSGLEAESCYAKSLVTTRSIDPAIVAAEKKKIIAKAGVLEWLEPLPGGLANVGGLDGVKSWVTKRALAFSPSARAYGLLPPKGILLLGISGCGKSLTPKALATEWRCPLVRFDFGALKGKFVGQSEGNLRKATSTIDSLGPCIVLVDEIEKGLAGATQGAADGGVSADALGTFLSWMNDRTSQAFVVATANDIKSIVTNAPELLRKGRFDELFFVDLPNAIERIAIVQATLNTYPRHAAAQVDYERVAIATEGFTGAEIASLIPEALFTAFADNERAPTTEDLLAAASTVVPLSETAKEKIAELRNWAKTRARSATTAQAPVTRQEPTGRVLDL